MTEHDYEIQGLIGKQSYEGKPLVIDDDGTSRVEGCDAKQPPVYSSTDGGYICRCIVCGHCGHHTGNSNQGHYWKICHVQVKLHDQQHKLKSHRLHCKECLPDFHFCCGIPDGCELFYDDGSTRP